MMQAQNILFILGLLTTPDGRRARPDIDGARVLIDQLGMIKEKTRGNLTAEENKVLNEVLARVRLAFVEVARSLGEDPKMDLPTPEELEETSSASQPVQSTAPSQGVSSAPTTQQDGADFSSSNPQQHQESKRRFFKSFG